MNIIQTIFGASIFDFVIRLMIMVIGVLLGVILTAFLTPPTQIQRMSEKDGRGWELNIKAETPKFLETKSKPPLRYLKWGRSYEFVRGFLKKKVTRFFGKEGTAYTWRLFGFDKELVECHEDEAEDYIEEKIPIADEDGNLVVLDGATEPAYKIKLIPAKYVTKKIDLPFDTVAELLEWRWGTKFYNTIPQKRREELMDNQVHMTVELETGLTPKGYTAITEQDINNEGDKNFLRLWAEEAKGALHTPWIQYIFIMATGGLATLGACILLGYIPVGT